MDAEGIGRAHVAGNSLGGWVAVELGRRGRALSVTALSPAGGWTRARDLQRVLVLVTAGVRMLERREQLRLAALLRRPRLRRLAFRTVMEHGDRVPVGQLAELIDDTLGCTAFEAFAAADAEAPLAPDDLELLARSAYLLGRDDDYLGGLERAQQAYLDTGNTRAAARCAFWIGHGLMFQAAYSLSRLESGTESIGSYAYNWKDYTGGLAGEAPPRMRPA